MIFMCQSDATIKFRVCKTKGHFRKFQRYFDLLSQQGFQLSFITSIKVDSWIHSAARWASMMHWRNMGNQANWQKLSTLRFLKIEVGRITNVLSVTQNQNFVLISSTRCGKAGVGLGASLEGENQIRLEKRIPLYFQI